MVWEKEKPLLMDVVGQWADTAYYPNIAYI